MSRRKRYIEKLTETEIKSLKKGYQTGKSHLYRRKCHCILLSHQGKSVSELSDFFSVSIQSIYKWFNLWETQGIKGLELKPGRGRPPKLDSTNKNQVDTIKTVVENEPQNLKRVVGQVKSELGIDLSKKTLKRFLKNLNSPGNALGEDSKINQTL